MNWAPYFRQAYAWAMESPDPSTQNGAVVVDRWGKIVAGGVNDFPPGVAQTAERWERPAKYAYVEHAERSALFNAGGAARGSTLVCCWAACPDCARAIILHGCQRLVTHAESRELRGGSSWDEGIAVADQMLAEAGVELVLWRGRLGIEGLQVRRGGEIWTP